MSKSNQAGFVNPNPAAPMVSANRPPEAGAGVKPFRQNEPHEQDSILIILHTLSEGLVVGIQASIQFV
jgi:hypothetical protein